MGLEGVEREKWGGMCCMRKETIFNKNIYLYMVLTCLPYFT